MFERLTWDEMVEKYPDRWLMLTNCETSNGVVLKADIYKILSDDNIQEYKLKYWDKGYRFIRTTEGATVGVIHAKNIKITVD